MTVAEERVQRVVLRGRSDEVAAVRLVLRATMRAGRAALVPVAGVPGIGKSAFLQATAEQAARAGFAVGLGKAEEIDQIAPGEALLVALRSGADPLLTASGFHELAELGERPLWLVERIGELLAERARQRPVLVAIDDVQWADRLTRFALRTLPPRLADHPIAWVTASRLATPQVSDEIVAAAGNTIDVTRIPLGDLSPDAIRDIARDRLGGRLTADQFDFVRRIGGNPFWAVQVVKGLIRRRDRGVPDEQMQAELLAGVRDRMAALAEETAELVRTAAICGRVLSIENAGRILGRPPSRIVAAANEAEDNGLLRVAAEGLSLPHDLLRQAVHDDTEPSERTRMHRTCARLLVAHGRNFTEAAPHFWASATAGDEEAARALLRAAVDNEALVPETAAKLARKAFELLPVLGPEVLDLLLRVQRDGDALQVADRLIATTTDPEAQARLQVQAGLALWPMGANHEIERRTDPAVGWPGISGTARARLQAVRSLASTRTEKAPEVAESAGRALAAGRRLGDELTQKLAVHALMEDARNTGRHQAVYDWGVELQRLSDGGYLAEHIRSLQHLDRYPEADDLLSAALKEVDDQPGRLLPSLWWVKMWQDHNLGRLADAETDAERLLQSAEPGGNFTFRMNAHIVLSAVAVYRDDLPGARRHLDTLDRSDEARDGLRVTRLRAAQAWLYGTEGDLPGSLAVLRPLLRNASDGHHSWPWTPPWMRTFARIAMSAGDRATAEQALRIAELGARRSPAVATMRGIALQVNGIVRRDRDALAEAVAVLRDAPRPLPLATALLDHGRALLRSGNDDEAASVLDEAAGIFAELAVVRGRRTVAELQERSGLRRDRRRRTTGSPLTEAENRVAGLIAAGYSSKAAAAELVVSINTVNYHVKSIYAKLGVRSRVELVNVLRTTSSGGAAEGTRRV
jgi:DNA-binding CsgD family transcriptional regulator